MRVVTGDAVPLQDGFVILPLRSDGIAHVMTIDAGFGGVNPEHGEVIAAVREVAIQARPLRGGSMKAPSLRKGLE